MNSWSDPRLTHGPCCVGVAWHREDDGCRLGAAACAFFVCSDFLVLLIRTAHL